MVQGVSGGSGWFKMVQEVPMVQVVKEVQVVQQVLEVQEVQSGPGWFMRLRLVQDGSGGSGGIRGSSESGG